MASGDDVGTLDPEFRPVLGAYDLVALEEQAGAVYGVWADFRLAYMNPAWFRFARDNGGEPAISTRWGLGVSILDCMAGEVRAFYAAELGHCLASGKPWSHDYECSSATVYRCFRELVLPLSGGAGLLVAHSLVVERPHDPRDRTAHVPDVAAYVNGNGFIRQCAWCRRVAHVSERERWDWVPAWVERCPGKTTHVLCPVCFGHYYPTAAAAAKSSRRSSTDCPG